jgi:Patatin-like phospholipase
MKNLLALPTITDADGPPARSLQVQLTTRITTQPLHYRSGDEETAVTSVYDLFDTTRGLLIANPKAIAFDVAAEFLLNQILRPYSARWHRWMVDERFTDERARRQFRYELKQLQPQLDQFVELLRMMVLGPEQAENAKQLFTRIMEATPRPGRSANLGGHVESGIGHEVPLAEGVLGSQLGSFATVDKINEAERRFLHRRRHAFGYENTQSAPHERGEPVGSECAQNKNPREGEKAQAAVVGAKGTGDIRGVMQAPVMDATGLCLSGGGIRSATFCLGIVQVLARQGLLPQFDYLSTVSGGGYLGSFLTSYLGTPESCLKPSKDDKFSKVEMEAAIKRVFLTENGCESDAVRHLRNNSRYLLDGGLWARVKIFGLLVTGILTNILLVLPIPLTAALVIFGLEHLGFWERCLAKKPPIFAQSIAANLLIWLGMLLGVAWIGLPLARNSARGKPPESCTAKFRVVWETVTLVLGLLALAAAVLFVLPAFFDVLDWFDHQGGRLGNTIEKLAKSKAFVPLIMALGPVMFGLLTARLKGGKAKRWAGVLFALSGPLLYLIVFLLVGHGLRHHAWNWRLVAVATATLVLWGWCFVDINDFSPHAYYRARLCECYLAVRHNNQTGRVRAFVHRFLHGIKKSDVVKKTGVGTRSQLPLSCINQTGAAPYHLVNAAANLPASHEPNLRGRDCDFFLFSRYYCGGPVCGYFETKILEQIDSHVDLGTAMAISGAAASSNMGIKTLRQYRFLITLLNVRLGYWLRNPISGVRRQLNAPGPLYLFREMTGWMHEKTAYLNLSDGGHIENLALYELLRRRCKFIVVVDGGMEPGMECADLMLAQRYAQIDLGVQFDLDLADLALNPQRRSSAYAVFGKIRYSPRGGESGSDLGWLVYLKLACTGGEPGYVIDYRRQNPDFPHQTTADQIYDEGQFEAYRRLGECAAESLFRGELAGDPGNPRNDSPADHPRFSTLTDWFQALANNLLPDNDEAFSNLRAKLDAAPPVAAVAKPTEQMHPT